MFESLFVDKEKSSTISRLLDTTPSCEEECFGENEKITVSKIFSDGKIMTIELRGLPYEPGEGNIPWTQAVLTEAEETLAVSEPDCMFFKTWTLEYNDIMYELEVISENEDFSSGKEESEEDQFATKDNLKATKELHYPYNLFYEAATWGRKEPMKDIVELMKIPLNEDHMKGLEEAISLLTEKENKLIYHYYIKRQHYSIVCRHADIGSVERARQIKHNILMKFRRQPFLDLIRYGKEGSKNKIKEQQKKRKDDYLNGFYDSETNTPVNELNISTRLKNALKRANIHSLFELANHTEEELMNIRNLGSKCVMECKQVLNDYELSLKNS